LVGVVSAYAQLDPCDRAHRNFDASARSTREAWLTVNAQLSKITFDPAQIRAQLRSELEKQAVQDIKDLVTATNTGLAENKKLHISDVNMKVAAAKKVDLALARPETKRYVEQVVQASEDKFLQDKAQKQLELAQNKKQMDDQIEAEHKKLDDNCHYDFPTQIVRIVAQVLSIDMRIQDGMVTIGDFKTDVPVISAGKVTLGNHYLMDLPVVKGGQVEIAGVAITQIPVISGGSITVPVVPGLAPVAQALHVNLPQITLPALPNISHGQVGPLKW